MKKITTLILIAFLSVSAVFGQETKEEEEFNTLLGEVESFGFYGGFNMGYSQIDNKNGALFGGQLALLLNHNIGIGFGGKAFMNEYHYDNNLAENVNLQGGYGGLLIEPILGAKQAVHFSFPILVGAGGIAHADKIYNYGHNYYYEDHINDTEAFFVVEPGAEVEFNLFKFFRWSLGASYRYTSNIDLYDTNKQVLHGFSFSTTFKFGIF